MKARNKIVLLTLGITLIFLMFIIQYHYIRKQQVEIFLKSEKVADEKVINKILEFKAASYLKPTKDNSAWDEMLEYTKTKDSAWAQENLEGVRITFDMSYIGAYDAKGNLLYSVCDSLSEDFKLNKADIEFWLNHNTLVNSYELINGYLYQIFGAPIVPSSDIFYKTKSQGYLISAKKWDSSYISEIAKTTGFNVKIINLKENQQSNENADLEVITKSVNDADGNEIMKVEFSKERTVASQVRYFNILAYTSIIVLIIALIFFFYLTSLWLTKPLKSITKSLKEGNIKPIELLFDKKNEFGEIAVLIKEFNEQKENLLIEVTERTKANEKYKALLIAQPDLMFILDRKGVFIDFYAPATKELYKAPSDFLGKTLQEVFPFSFINDIYSSMDDIFNSNNVFTIEYELEMPDGIHYNEARFVPIDNEHLLTLVRDITDNKLVEKELISAKEKAQESDRLKSAFLANMSHEIRTPMHAILGFSKLLEDESITQADKLNFISIINRSGEELLTLINDIIDISKIDSNLLEISKSTFNLNHLIDNLMITFESEKQRLDKSDIKFVLEKGLENKYALIVSDKIRLTQVINNLISNALKFTLKGTIKFGYRHDGKYLMFYVEDTGKGIAEENLSLIFERFRQEDESNERNYGGAGLGLPISKGFIELLGGKIWVESEEGKGSKFFFTLPYEFIETPEIDLNKTSHQLMNCNFKGKTILIVEDIIENYELLSIYLRNTNANLIYAENGAIAVEKVNTEAKIDCVLMDIRMPIMNGYTATREIKKINPNIPIIALTAHAFSEEKKRCYEAGCNGFISKPINKEELLLTIESFLKSQE